jgi:hypothetical protein
MGGGRLIVTPTPICNGKDTEKREGGEVGIQCEDESRYQGGSKGAGGGACMSSGGKMGSRIHREYKVKVTAKQTPPDQTPP